VRSERDDSHEGFPKPAKRRNEGVGSLLFLLEQDVKPGLTLDSESMEMIANLLRAFFRRSDLIKQIQRRSLIVLATDASTLQIDKISERLFAILDSTNRQCKSELKMSWTVSVLPLGPAESYSFDASDVESRQFIHLRP